MPTHTTIKWYSRKKKNRHLVETAHTLLLGANVPVHHWGDAILTTCFLINRMPSSSLENRVPHSILFPKEPLFHVSPRICSCTCFVHDVSPGLEKLSAKAIKCVFLGYFRLQKGYHCYSPRTKQYYKSADVTFEETPTFSSSMQDFNSVQQVLLVPSLTPLVSPVHEIPSMDTSQATYPISPTRSPQSVDQHESQRKLSSPMSQGQSFASCQSPSTTHTTVPI